MTPNTPIGARGPGAPWASIGVRALFLPLWAVSALLLAAGTLSAEPPPAPPAPEAPVPAPAAEPPQPAPAAPQPSAAGPRVGRVRGEGVNLRVGPRQDNEPIVQLARGTIVIVVEDLPGWYGVRVPVGFPVAVAGDFVKEQGPDEVRVTAKRLNVRVQPPEEGRPQPGAFRDQFQADQVLLKISADRGWVWVLAPEEFRAYLSTEYVEVLGPLEQHAAEVETARAARAREVERLKEARAAAAAAAAALGLRGAIGAAQRRLQRLRLEATNDRLPVALVADELKAAIAAGNAAPPVEQSLARLMAEDLDRELEIRAARADRDLAKTRGAPGGKPVPTPAPAQAALEVEGVLRWEAIPGWQDGGVFILWSGEKPAYVVRLAPGGPIPPPDLRAHCDGRPRRLKGSAPGERSMGLPVIDVKDVGAPAPGKS